MNPLGLLRAFKGRAIDSDMSEASRTADASTWRAAGDTHGGAGQLLSSSKATQTKKHRIEGARLRDQEATCASAIAMTSKSAFINAAQAELQSHTQHFTTSSTPYHLKIRMVEQLILLARKFIFSY